jgi:5-methylcytosine-specific restriction endonuclease McrA
LNNNKICSKCKRELPATNEYFAKSKDSKDGLRWQCKECSRKASREWYKENIDHVKVYDKKYSEENRELILKRKRKYLEEHKELERKRKREDYYRNKETRKAKHKEWLENNKDKTLQRQREYYKEKPEVFSEIRQRRRSRKKNVEHNFSWEEWENCIEHFQHKCAYCGKKKKLQQDHFIPLNNGGEYTTNNIVPACKSCNSGKCDRDFFEWYPTKEFYSKKREKFILDYLDYQSKNIQQLALFK